jgi:hypothetical protein
MAKHKIQRYIWTEREEEILKMKYSTSTSVKLAKELNLTSQQVRTKANLLGLSKYKQKDRRTIADGENVIEMFSGFVEHKKTNLPKGIKSIQTHRMK